MKSFALMLPASVAAVPHIPGSTRARLVELQAKSLQHHGLFHTAGDGHWTETGFYIVAPVLLILIIVLIVKCIKGPPQPSNLLEIAEAQAELDQQMKELAEAEKEMIAAAKRGNEEEPEEEETEGPDYEGALRAFAQMAAQTVGPKVAKGQAVKTILETRVDTLQKQTKAFVLDEVNGTAGAVLNELGAEEAMLLLDPKKALEGNFPPAAVLLAGLMSPLIMALTAVNHILQAFLHFLPIICLCIAAVIIDEGSVCFIPYMKEWVWAHLVMGTILFFAHLCQVVKVYLARCSLQKEIEGRTEDIKKLTKNKAPSVSDVRNVFISVCVIVQKALQSEDAVRRSFFNLIVGLGTMIWIILTIWTFVIVIGYTFVPGVIAFHESAKETAGDEYCGTWMSVLAARLCCIIGVVFLMINIMIVSQWFADGLRYQPGYVEQVLAQAKKADDQAGGVPVMQTLVKAFVLRGSSDTLEVQAACAAQDKYRVESELKVAQRELSTCQSELAAVESRLGGYEAEVKALPPRGFVKIEKPAPAPAAAAAGPGLADKAQDALAQGQQALEQGEEALREGMDKAQAQLEKAKKEAEEALAKAKEQGEEALAEAKKQTDALVAAASAEADKLKAQFDSIDWDEQRRKAMEMAEEKKKQAIEAAQELQRRTKEELEKMIKLIMEKLEELRNSDAVKSAIAEAQKRAEEAQKLAQEAMESEEFQALKEGDTSKLQAKVQEGVEKGKKMVEEGVEQGKQMVQEGVEQAKNIDPEEAKKQLAEKAAQAKEAASEKAAQAKEAASSAAESAQEKVVKKK